MNSWKYNSCNPGITLIKNIKKLNAGVNLEIKNKKIKKIEHSKFNIEKWLNFFKKNPSENDVFDKFEKIFQREVELRIPKDVSFFLTLSGGLDSTILALFLHRSIKNFNVLFGISDDETKKVAKFSELNVSKMTAKYLKLKYHLTYLYKNNAIDDLKYFSSNSFDGCIDAGTSNFSGLAKYVKNKKSKVTFVSDGPDELLGGYEVDIESNKLDEYLKKKKLKKISLKRKIEIIKKFDIKKNTEIELSYKPFYSKVNHSVCPDIFLKKIIKNYNSKSIKSYGSLDKRYQKIIKKLDYSQLRALSYATKTLPDMFNLRIDKAFMKNSVEARLPYQAIKLVEFFIAMPKIYRFGKNNNSYGKYFLRRYLLKRGPKLISEIIASRPKIGMGNYLWNNKTVYKKLNFDKVIKKSKFFDKFPFKKNIKPVLLKKNTHSGNKWAAYNFIKMYEKLNEFRK